jgi:hypothetical protein
MARSSVIPVPIKYELETGVSYDRIEICTEEVAKLGYTVVGVTPPIVMFVPLPDGADPEVDPIQDPVKVNG